MPAIVVNNQTQLDAAIKVAKGGDTILLAAGTYASVTMTNINPTSNITIQSLDPKNPAVVGKVWLTNSSNIALKDFSVVRTAASTDALATANRVLMSSNITIDGVKFSGGTGDPSASLGVGLSIRGGTNNKIVNSSVDHFVVGMDVRGVNGMLVRGNSFYDNRTDHTNFSEMTNVTIDNNRFEGLYPLSGEHPDAIQFMTFGRATGNTNVKITNNIVLQGAGGATQGIFLNEEAGNLPYQNVLIQNNLIYLSGMFHGINVDHGQNVTIDSNTVLSVADEKSTWIRVSDVSGKITNNVADQIQMAGTNTLTTNHNIELLNDPDTMRGISDLNLGSKAKISGLLVKGIGYAPVAGSTAAKIVATELAAATTASGPKLLLDLNFTAQGLVDASNWSTDESVTPVAASAVVGGMLKVSTGAGMELVRGTSRQLFGLSAFTLNFDMKRDGQTAPAGQIVGIYKSWGVSLRADGELSFTMTNAAGKSFSLVTSGARILDTATHKIAVTYDSVRGMASLYVDGVVRGTAAMSGTTRKQESWGLSVGHPFNAAFSGSVGDIEMRDSALSAAQILALNAGSTLTTAAKTADTVKAMVTKSVADSATTLANTTAWGSTASLPATLSLSFGTAAGVQSPLAAALASASGTGSLASSTGSFSALVSSRSAAYDLHYA